MRTGQGVAGMLQDIVGVSGRDGVHKGYRVAPSRLQSPCTLMHICEETP